MTDDTLSAFKRAIQAGDFATAIDRYDDVNRALQVQQQRDRGVLRIARAVIAQTPPSAPINQQAQQFVELSGNAEQQRLSLNFQFFGLIAGDVSPAAVVEDVEDTIALRNKLQTAAATLRDNAGEQISLPAIAIYGVTQPDTPIIAEETRTELAVTVENVGTTVLDTLSITTTADEGGIDISVSPTSVERLDPGETQEVSLAILASDEGTTTGTIDVDAGDVTASEQLPLNVFDKADFLEAALATIQQTRDFLESEVEKAVRGVDRRLEEVQEDVTEAKSEAEDAEDDSDATQINSQIDTAINLIGGLISETANGEVPGLSDAQQGRLEQNLREIDDDLEQARTTPI